MKNKPRPRLMYLRHTAPNECYTEAVEIKSDKDIPRGVRIDLKKGFYTVKGYYGCGYNINRLLEFPIGQLLYGPRNPHEFLGIFELDNVEHIKKVVRFVDEKAMNRH